MIGFSNLILAAPYQGREIVLAGKRLHNQDRRVDHLISREGDMSLCKIITNEIIAQVLIKKYYPVLNGNYKKNPFRGFVNISVHY